MLLINGEGNSDFSIASGVTIIWKIFGVNHHGEVLIFLEGTCNPP